jgi:predicted GNAT family acetyltransferase
MSETVRDNTARNRFELEVDGVIAFSEYHRKNGVVTFIHTEVPDSLGGKGVGSRLAKGALDLVSAAGEKVIARCPFIAAYIKKHAEYQDLLTGAH